MMIYIHFISVMAVPWLCSITLLSIFTLPLRLHFCTWWFHGFLVLLISSTSHGGIFIENTYIVTKKQFLVWAGFSCFSLIPDYDHSCEKQPRISTRCLTMQPIAVWTYFMSSQYMSKDY